MFKQIDKHIKKLESEIEQTLEYLIREKNFNTFFTLARQYTILLDNLQQLYEIRQRIEIHQKQKEIEEQEG